MAATQILHGKEGVDGSSPSEGSKSPLKRVFAQIDMTEHLLEREGVASRVAGGETDQTP
jgi:hypothetical protein